MNKRLLVTILIASGIVVLLVAISVGVLKKTSNVVLEIAPDGATVLLDGEKKLRAGKLFISPGKHTLRASLDGFTEVAKTVVVTQDKVVKVTLLLDPNSKAGYDYLEEHPSEELHREALGGRQFSSQTNSLARANPIITSLPFIDRLYRIDYGTSKKSPNNPAALAIYITFYDDAAKQDALDWIQFKGIDPATLEIIFIDGRTPRGD